MHSRGYSPAGFETALPERPCSDNLLSSVTFGEIMPPNGFKCKQCGHCCLDLNAFATCASEEDVERWASEGRDDILEWVVPVAVGDVVFAYDIWLDPKTGDDVSRCPWLQKLPNKNEYICLIQDTKPELCSTFPKSRAHADKTGCPGFAES
jgi:Fe-S-cluster containining protein